MYLMPSRLDTTVQQKLNRCEFKETVVDWNIRREDLIEIKREM